MKIGFSIFLLAVGAVLTFALHYTVVGVNIHIVGWILMVAGVIGLILTMLVSMPRKGGTVTSPAVVPAVTPEIVVPAAPTPLA